MYQCLFLLGSSGVIVARNINYLFLSYSSSIRLESGSSEDRIDFCGQDKVVVAQATDGVGR